MVQSIKEALRTLNRMSETQPKIKAQLHALMETGEIAEETEPKKSLDIKSMGFPNLQLSPIKMKSFNQNSQEMEVQSLLSQTSFEQQTVKLTKERSKSIQQQKQKKSILAFRHSKLNLKSSIMENFMFQETNSQLAQRKIDDIDEVKSILQKYEMHDLFTMIDEKLKKQAQSFNTVIIPSQMRSNDSQVSMISTMLQNFIQSYIPYQLPQNLSPYHDLKIINQLTEQTAIMSLGLKKKITKIEFLKIMTTQQLSLQDKALRPLIIETSLAFFDLEYIDVIIASFFLNYTQMRFLSMCFIADTLTMIANEFMEIISNDKKIQEKLLYYALSGETLLNEFSKSQHNSETKILVDNLIQSLKEMKFFVTKKVRKQQSLDYHSIFSTIDSDFDEDKFAKMLHKMDMNFLNSLRLSDFFANPSLSFNNNTKFIKYIEYQNAIYQVFKNYILIETEKFSSSYSSNSSFTMDPLTAKILKLIKICQTLLDLSNFNMFYCVSKLLLRDKQIVELWKKNLADNLGIFKSLRKCLDEITHSNFDELLGKNSRTILVFSHLIKHIEKQAALNQIYDKSEDKVNLENLRKYWKMIRAYLLNFKSDL